MGNESSWSGSQCLSTLNNIFRKYLFRVLSCGAIPTHIAFIMDGNRRFAKKQNMVEGEGHRAGYKSLISMLNYCYELGVKYITVYAFSIENFKRKPEEVQYLMDLMVEKIDELLRDESIVNQYGMRLYFIGNLKLLSEEVRTAAEKAMKATAHNSQTVLLICVAYTSYDEIVHAVKESCEEKMNKVQAENSTKAGRDSTDQNGSCEKMNGVYPPEIQDCHKHEVHGTVILGKNDICCNGFSKLEASEKKNGVIKHAVPGFCGEKWNEVQESLQSQLSKGTVESSEDGEMVREIKPLVNLVDIEKHMYMAVAPDPDIVIRSSGETRLSNFLLWQTGYSPLYSPAALWPEIGLWHLVGVVLHYQRNYSYLQKKRKQS
ncbi:Protein kinase domain-containing protein [Psidium guajava]|nr:Protein kinase domain-containing protein [Psidium guajava]